MSGAVRVASVAGKTGAITLETTDVTGLEPRLTSVENGRLLVANNLSDLANAATARTNLGLGTAATQPISAFEATGVAASLDAALVPKSIGTTKGDLIVWNASAIPVRKAVGADGQALVADSTQTGGVKWSTLTGTVWDTSLSNTEHVSANGTIQATHAFFITSRSAAGLTYAAVFARSANANSPTAFDVMPNGSGYASGNGYAWFDACDENVESTGTCGVARLSLDSDHGYVGTLSYKGGAITNNKPFFVRVPTNASGGSEAAVKHLQALNGAVSADLGQLSCDPHVQIGAHGGTVILGSGYRLPTNATTGLVYMPVMAGQPTGAPSLQSTGYTTGWSSSFPYSLVGAGHCVPVVQDETNFRQWARFGSTWKYLQYT
jgi:hypothetical protein